MSSRALMRSPLRAALTIAALVTLGTVDMGSVTIGEAHAVVGRPLTPVSVAGVARRTTRRTVAATGGYGYGGYGYGYGAAAAAAVALPPGCSPYGGGGYYGCGGRYYQPVYDGPEVRYVVVDRPPG